MSDDKNKKKPPKGAPTPRDAEDERTVFAPSTGMPPVPTPRDSGFIGDSEVVGASPPDVPPAEQATVIAGPPVADPKSAEAAAPPAPIEPATVIAGPPTADAAPEAPAAEPETVVAAPPPPPPAAEPPPATPTATGTSSGTSTPFVAREAQKIQVGDVLNHIFEVKRFLARGGMGEVFEGCNVNTDERVAIKVMLPSLAAEEKVVAMFRKEARTLTKLQHEALVSYRVLAQEPQLGVLYIVTEFIEGVSLGDALGTVERSADDLRGLLLRLASGLGAAHKLGAIHRDISPDNVLLPNGDVHQAKIIDFGIAKDLDASSATIVGDGFAGKLNYVAPEQLGDFGREVGPWTDVYSLALVILAVAGGKAVNMSGSLVDAIDKRRKGPDLATAPDGLRHVLEAMLRPDPKDRLRSMDDVIAMLGGAVTTSPPPLGYSPAMTAPPTYAPPGSGLSTPAPGGGGGSSKGLLIGGALAAALVVGGGAWYWTRGAPTAVVNGVTPTNDVGPVSPTTPPADPVAAARTAINSVLPSVTCTWLDIANVTGGGDGVRVAMRGVAGDARAAEAELAQALTRAGVANARIDFGDVAPITQAGCAALDTYRQVRADGDYHLSVAQPRFQMVPQPPGSAYPGELASNAVINFSFGNLQGDFAVLGIEPSGLISLPIPDRADFDARLAQSVNGRPITDEGGDRYRLNIDLNHQGWSGIILITGTGPFPQEIVAPPVGARGPNWQQQFLAMAADRGWRVEMVWFESVNRAAQQDNGSTLDNR